VAAALAIALAVGATRSGLLIDAEFGGIGAAHGNRGADAGAAGQGARQAGALAIGGAADALGAEPRRAFIGPVLRAGGAVGALAAGPVLADVGGRALGVVVTGHPAAIAVADIRRAGSRGDLTGATVAGPDRRLTGVRIAALSLADGAVVVVLAAALAVAAAVLATGGDAFVDAGQRRIGDPANGARIGHPRGHHAAMARGIGQGARRTQPLASAVTADAVDTEVGGALRAGLARLAKSLGPAAALHAFGRGQALIVALTSAAAQPLGAHERCAADGGPTDARARLVADAGRAERRARAGRGLADAAHGVPAAATLAVAGAAFAAGRGIILPAHSVGILDPGGRGGADTAAVGQTAAEAGAGAADVAADPIGADPGFAVDGRLADATQRLFAARAVDAGNPDALIVAGAGRKAGAAGRITGKRRAGDGRAVLADPGRAGLGVQHLPALTAARRADGSVGITPAAAAPITAAIEAAAGGRLDDALAFDHREGAVGYRGTRADLSRDIACHAAAGAGAVAADAVDAEAGGAFVMAAAGVADRPGIGRSVSADPNGGSATRTWGAGVARGGGVGAPWRRWPRGQGPAGAADTHEGNRYKGQQRESHRRGETERACPGNISQSRDPSCCQPEAEWKVQGRQRLPQGALYSRPRQHTAEPIDAKFPFLAETAPGFLGPFPGADGCGAAQARRMRGSLIARRRSCSTGSDAASDSVA
jgi:hypothetical protein